MEALSKYIDSLTSIATIDKFESWNECKNQIITLSFPAFKETIDCKASRQKLVELKARGYAIVNEKAGDKLPDFQCQESEQCLSSIKTHLPKSIASGTEYDAEDVEISKDFYFKGLELAKRSTSPQVSMTKLQEIWAAIETLCLNQPKGADLQSVMKSIREQANAIVKS